MAILGTRFTGKLIAGIVLVVLADRLFWAGGGIGSNIGIFAGAWLALTVLSVAAITRDVRAMLAVGIALLLAAILTYDPGPLAVLLFGGALMTAAVLPRLARYGSALGWLGRFALLGLTAVVGPWRDLMRLRPRTRPRGSALRRALPLLPLPLIGGGIFLTLFAAANPVIETAFASIAWPDLGDWPLVRIVFWGLIGTLVWASLRPRRVRIGTMGNADLLPQAIPGVSVGSVTLSLAVFNALFALQNGLDIAFLWSGAPLPEGVTLADYAHRGAYPLIGTALLAGLFVLVTLRPGSETAAVPRIRQLVILWVAQNVLLVASTMLRTFDYIEAYSLTEWRIAALIWMGLVALGLVLVLWRMLAGKSATWLVNANAAAAMVVLTVSSAVDFGATAAAWNVRHAREVGGRGAALDLCYLRRLGPSALVSLVRLERTPGLRPDFAERVVWVRAAIQRDLNWTQRDGDWVWHDAMRQAEVAPLLAGRPYPQGLTGTYDDRQCDGSPLPPSEPEAVVAPDPELANAIDHVAGEAENAANAARHAPPLTKAGAR